MAKFSTKIIKKIKEEKVIPVPKWQFLLKDSFIWTLFVLSILFGSLGISIVIYLVHNSEILTDLSWIRSFSDIFIFGIPLLWFLIVLFFVFTIFYHLKNTEGAFRYGILRIFVVSLLLSLFLGFILFKQGVSYALSNMFEKKIPQYTKLMDSRYSVWMRPEEGFLAGDVNSIDTINKEISLSDLDGKDWDVNYSEARVRGRVTLQEGERVKILGSVSEGSTFNAIDIRPWDSEGRGSHLGNGRGRGRGMQ